MAWYRAPEVVLPWLLLAGALVAVPVFGDEYLAYQLGLYLLYGMVAQGIALVWGRCGFLPLGQALFFGLGAYIAGFALKGAMTNLLWWAVLPLAVLLPALFAWGVARLLFAGRHESGPFFSLVTLALAMLGFQVANQWSTVTGGFNGLTGIPELPGLDRYSTMYWLIAGTVLLATAIWVWLDRAPLGTLWRAIADHEDRLQFFGFATDRLKALAFGLSGGLGGLAGALYAPHQGLVTPTASGFQLSAELLIWTAVGGRSSPYGALIGAVGIGWLSSMLRERFIWWEVLIALTFIVVVLRQPGGVAGWLESLGRIAIVRWSSFKASATPIPAPRLRSRGGGAANLRFESVSARQHGVSILDGLDLVVETPGVHGIIGPNGAGKTSSFNALTARLPLAGGRIVWRGEDLAVFSADAIARRGVGRKFQIPSVFATLSVADHLRIATWAGRAGALDLLRSRSHRWSSPLRAELEATLPFLRTAGDRPAGALSQGERQMLELAASLIPEPALLLLDEPCAGLSPPETALQISIIGKVIAQLGTTALLIEHDMHAVEKLATRVHVLHQGRLLASGSMVEVQSNAAVRRVYGGGRK